MIQPSLSLLHLPPSPSPSDSEAGFPTPLSPPFYSSLRAFDQSTTPAGIKGEQIPPAPRRPSLIASTTPAAEFPSSYPSPLPRSAPAFFHSPAPPSAFLPLEAYLPYSGSVTEADYDQLVMTRGNSIDCPITQEGLYSTLNEEPYTPVSETYSFEEVESNEQRGSYQSEPSEEMPIQGEEVENGPCRCSYPLCRWTTFDGDHFRAHLESHRSGRRFECYVDECGSLFDYTEDLCTHTTSYHSNPAPRGSTETADRAHFLSTPDHTPNLPTGLFPVYPSSAPMSIARTLSYGGTTPHAPLLARSLTYNGAHSAPPVMSEFSLASMQPRDEPHRLASPLGFADRPGGSRRTALPNIRVDSPHLKSNPAAFHPHSARDHSVYSHPPVTPISPVRYIPSSTYSHHPYFQHANRPSTPQQPRPSSSYSSPEVTPRTYATAQAALVSAKSLNRMLARLTPDVSPEPVSAPAVVVKAKFTKRKRYGSAEEDDYQSDHSSASSTYHDDKPEPVGKAHSRVKPIRNDDIDEKPHLCDFAGCGQRFKRAEHKKRHYKIHAKEKPYGCDVAGCGRFFSYVSLARSLFVVPTIDVCFDFQEE